MDFLLSAFIGTITIVSMIGIGLMISLVRKDIKTVAAKQDAIMQKLLELKFR